MSILSAQRKVEERRDRWLAAVNGIDTGDSQPEKTERIDEFEAAAFGLGFNTEGEG